MPPAPRRLGPLPARLAALGLGVVFACGVLEIGLRAMPHAISPRLLILFEPGLRAELAAGTFPVSSDFSEVARDDGGPPLRIPIPGTPIVSVDAAPDAAAYDERGFCNPSGSYDSRATIDVVSVGDSFTWCHSVTPTDTWTYLLGRATGLSTYNLGKGGIGLYEYLQILKTFGLEKRPDVVIFSIYGGNDLRDASRFHEYRETVRLTGLPPREEPESIAPRITHGPLGRYSYVANLAVAFATRVAARDPERGAVDFGYTVGLPSGAVSYNVENRDRDEVIFARKLAAGEVSPKLWDDALASLAALSRARDFDVILAYIPSAHVAHREQVTFDDPALAEPLAALDRAQRAHLASRAQALELVFHDLTPDLRDAATSTDSLLYHPANLHLTPQGHMVIADSLTRLIQARSAAMPAGEP